MTTLLATIEGIPCKVRVEHYVNHPGTGNSYTADSDWDYYGWEELEYTVLDRKGYKAAWLERKLDANRAERERLERIIKNTLKEGEDD